MASQLERLELRRCFLTQPIIRGCSVPFLNLVDLNVETVPPTGSNSHLILAPNLRILQISLRRQWSERNMLHGLGYMLSPEGMLGPIRALNRLCLQDIALSDESHPDYCTRHLRLHPGLEYLTFEWCQIPEDFLEFINKPVGASDEFLPDLKNLCFKNCRNGPSGSWIAELAIIRPSLLCYRIDS
jgi:hypothetical protein